MAEKSGLHPAGVGFANCEVFDHLQSRIQLLFSWGVKKIIIHAHNAALQDSINANWVPIPLSESCRKINISERKELYPKCVHHCGKNIPKMRKVSFSCFSLFLLYFGSSLWCCCQLCRGWAYLQDLAAVRGAVDVLAGLVHAQRHAV